MLDYDGTLAPFQVDRDRAIPYPGVRECLRRILAAKCSRLVLISGRSSSDLIALLGLNPHPEIWGSHGWERLMPDGTYDMPQLDAPVVEGLTKACWAMKEEGLADHCERKPAGVALHWRGMDASFVRRARAIARERWGGLVRPDCLALKEFDGGLELRVPGRSKGDVVRSLLAEMPTGTAAAYLGDDLTDEDAFGAIRDRGLAVLVRPEYRSTAADVWLRPPEELIDFLNQWHDRSRKG